MFTAGLVLILPYLATDFSPHFWNNDYLYITISRIFRDRPWTWNSLHYAGTPFHNLYPPLFPFLVAELPVHSVGRAYHIVGGTSFALVPVALYFLALQLFASRMIAGLVAAVHMVLPSPLYSLFRPLKAVAVGYHQAPWGFIALAGYEEAPHLLALVFSLLAVTAALRGHWKLASLGAAAVLLSSWPGAIGFGMMLAALGAALYVASRSAAWRVVGLAGAGYGLAAFWMTPGLFRQAGWVSRVILAHENGSAVAAWGLRTGLIVSIALLAVAVCLWRRLPGYATFTFTLLAVSGAVLAADFVAGNQLVPIPHRYALECDVALILALGCLLQVSGRWRSWLMVVVTAGCAFASAGFVRHAWSLEPRSADPRAHPAYQISQWLAAHPGPGRVYTLGEVEAVLNLWTDVPQTGEVHQMPSNLIVEAAQREIAYGCESMPDLAEMWLRALQVDYLVVHDAASREYFHWFARPERFSGFPVAWTNHEGDTIYQIPDPGSQAVVVDLKQLAGIGMPASSADLPFLSRYVAWAHGLRPADIRWTDPANAILGANLGPDDGLLVKTNYDPGWSATTGVTGSDPIGFLLIRAAPGGHKVAVHFGASWDVWLGRCITLITLILIFLRVPWHAIGLTALIPALTAYGFLSLHKPTGAAIGAENYQRVHPALISPGGIVRNGQTASIYGINFGSAGHQVRVLVGSQEAKVTYHGTNQLNVELPAETPATAPISVEVNGCQGNAFYANSRKSDTQ